MAVNTRAATKKAIKGFIAALGLGTEDLLLEAGWVNESGDFVCMKSFENNHKVKVKVDNKEEWKEKYLSLPSEEQIIDTTLVLFFHLK